MGTRCQIRVESPDQAAANTYIQAAQAEITRLEKTYSRYLESSWLSRLNTSHLNGEQLIDAEAHHLLNYADHLFTLSDGLFDITAGALYSVWDFTRETVPEPLAIEQALSNVGWPKLSWCGQQHWLLPEGMALDFGGMVKEYAADAALAVLRQQGVTKALVDLGGDITVSGGGWPIAVKNPVTVDPASTGHSLQGITLDNGAFATSGNYERCFMHQGKRYSHILNPKTGWPQVTPASVSVIADNCLVAGSIATIAMLKGEVNCVSWLDEIGLPYFCVFNDGRTINRMTYSEGE